MRIKTALYGLNESWPLHGAKDAAQLDAILNGLRTWAHSRNVNMSADQVYRTLSRKTGADIRVVAEIARRYQSFWLGGVGGAKGDLSGAPEKVDKDQVKAWMQRHMHEYVDETGEVRVRPLVKEAADIFHAYVKTASMTYINPDFYTWARALAEKYEDAHRI
jgi:hypothetical protein